MSNKKAVQQTISTPVYYYIDDEGKVIFDIEQMQEEFEKALEELENVNK